ncbi:MAG: phosphotransferase [Gemmatimonadota bacterium]|nr:MAG: phosphotransferase [Gemmatimonadota bacterium]
MSRESSRQDPTATPLGYSSGRCADARIVARDDAISFVREAISEAGTLFDFAAAHPKAEAIRGRGAVYLIPGPTARRWVVRRLVHGGLLAPLTGDRFLRHGTPRPYNELYLSVELNARGIPTPPVVAAVVYPSGLFYRGEVAREEISDAQDLASCLFGQTRLDQPQRMEALGAAGRLIAALHRTGLSHTDLNMRNVLIRMSDSSPRAYILDLEKCRMAPHVGEARRRRMIARLRRSARRFEQRTGLRLSADEWAAFRHGYAG